MCFERSLTMHAYGSLISKDVEPDCSVNIRSYVTAMLGKLIACSISCSWDAMSVIDYHMSVVMSMSVCLSVCLSVCEHISGTAHPIFAFFAHVTCDCVLFWRRCDTLCISGFMDDVILHKTAGTGDAKRHRPIYSK